VPIKCDDCVHDCGQANLSKVFFSVDVPRGFVAQLTALLSQDEHATCVKADIGLLSDRRSADFSTVFSFVISRISLY
jgi:hypothetical protein